MRVISKKNILFSLLVPTFVLILIFINLQNVSSSSDDKEKEEFEKIYGPEIIKVWELGECQWVPQGTLIKKVLSLQETILNHLIIIKEQSELNFFHGKVLAELAQECKAGNCNPGCFCEKQCPCDEFGESCCKCTPLPCQGRADDIYRRTPCLNPPVYPWDTPCPEGTPCPWGLKMEETKKKILEENKRVRENFQFLESLSKEEKGEIVQLKKAFEEIEKTYKEWFPERGKKVLQDCFETLDIALIKDCPNENDYYICWPKEEK